MKPQPSHTTSSSTSRDRNQAVHTTQPQFPGLNSLQPTTEHAPSPYGRGQGEGSALLTRLAIVLFTLALSIFPAPHTAAQAQSPTPAHTPAPAPSTPFDTTAESQHQPNTPTDIILLIGAPGNNQFANTFAAAAADWQHAAQLANANITVIGPTNPHSTNTPAAQPNNETPQTANPEPQDLTTLESTLASLPTHSSSPLWIALVGHGTFDGKAAKFNLRGPDLTPQHLVQLLEPFASRTVIIVNGAPASSPFLSALTAPNHIVITATNNPAQNSATRFGPYFAAAVADPTADLDKDNQVSLLEAFLVTSRRVADFYETEGRLATEQPLLDDNADTLGTRVEFFRGIRPVRQPNSAAQLDGYRAHQIVLVPSPAERTLPPDQRARRDQLELQIVQLRDSADQLPETQYLAQLNALFTELALIYEKAESDTDTDTDTDTTPSVQPPATPGDSRP